MGGVCLLAVAFALLSPLNAQQEITVSSNHFPIAIPDDDADFPIESTISVPADLVITDVNVAVTIDHTSIGDLELDLFSPDGERVRLANNECEGAADFEATVFDDDVAASIGDVCPPGSGSYRPDDELSEYDEEFAIGFWSLVVEDTRDDGVGSLLGWSITITGDFATGPVFGPGNVVSGASFQGGAVAVGEITTVFGRALGPAEGVFADLDPNTGELPTELAGARVMIDEVAAPLFYVSSSQINFQTPFEIAARPDVSIRVEFDETGSASTNVPLLDAGPAVFTLNGRGQGQAVARNPNGSVNDVNNPVPAGEAVSLYATGLGQVAPSIPSGVPASSDPLRRVVETVSVSLGGESAEVLFAGLAPGFVGLYQIDVAVPESVPSSSIVPIGLSVNGRGLENLAWISVD